MYNIPWVSSELRINYCEMPSHQNWLLWIFISEEMSKIFGNDVGVVVEFHEEVIVVDDVVVDVEDTEARFIPQLVPALRLHSR